MPLRRLARIAVFAVAAAVALPPVAAALTEEEAVAHSVTFVLGSRGEARDALAALVEAGDPRFAHTVITGGRFSTVPQREVMDALGTMTGVDGPTDWFEWMLWQEQSAETAPHPSYGDFQRQLYARIDPRFADFLPPGVAHEIRLEEIVWGGVRVDGIPALTNPDFVAGAEADYLRDADLVFGVEINGDARAYPLRILNWHEMFNDVVGGVPVSLAYCTLCGAGILFDTTVEGRDEPFVFGSSGFLFRSNKLMYDTATRSLWNQFTGRPVVGPLTGSGIELAIRPVAITSWARWRDLHPDTRVLSLETGHRRDYRPGAAYGAYFASDDLMFPALLHDDTLAAKSFVFGIRAPGGAKAWPLDAFEGGAVINDRVGLTDIVLIGDAATRTVRAYGREGIAFERSGDGLDALQGDGAAWTVTEEALVADDGRTLPRQAGHVAYWFAWAGYLQDAEIYAGAE